jgi:hypothetical protein
VGANPGLCGEKPAANRLSYITAKLTGKSDRKPENNRKIHLPVSQLPQGAQDLFSREFQLSNSTVGLKNGKSVVTFSI